MVPLELTSVTLQDSQLGLLGYMQQTSQMGKAFSTHKTESHTNLYNHTYDMNTMEHQSEY